MKKVLVTGGREYFNREVAFRVLDEENPDEVVCGAATGADQLALDWAYARERIKHPHPANWYPKGTLDRSAGHKRNAAMLVAHPDISLVIAFPGGKGTAGMVQMAQVKGIPVREVPLQIETPQERQQAIKSLEELFGELLDK